MHSTFSHSRNTVREIYIFRLAIGRMANKRQKQTVYKIYTRERRKKQQLKQIITYVDSISNMLMMDLFFVCLNWTVLCEGDEAEREGVNVMQTEKKRAK